MKDKTCGLYENMRDVDADSSTSTADPLPSILPDIVGTFLLPRTGDIEIVIVEGRRGEGYSAQVEML